MKKIFFVLIVGTIFSSFLPILAMKDDFDTSSPVTPQEQVWHTRIFQFSDETLSDEENKASVQSPERDEEELVLNNETPEQSNNQQNNLGRSEPIACSNELLDGNGQDKIINDKYYTIGKIKTLSIEELFKYKK